jgi:hypothetical protein
MDEMPVWSTPPSPRYLFTVRLYGTNVYLRWICSGTERLAGNTLTISKQPVPVDCTGDAQRTRRSPLVAWVW